MNYKEPLFRIPEIPVYDHYIFAFAIFLVIVFTILFSIWVMSERNRIYHLYKKSCLHTHPKIGKGKSGVRVKIGDKIEYELDNLVCREVVSEITYSFNDRRYTIVTRKGNTLKPSQITNIFVS